MSPPGWEIHERVARGLSGDWFLARREVLYRDAAQSGLLWRMGEVDELDRAVIERFILEEGWIGERIGGPVFQRVLAWGTEPEPHFVLEPIDAVPVRRLLARGRETDDGVAARVGIELADELARVHELRADDDRDLGLRGLRLGADRVWLTPEGVRAANRFPAFNEMRVRAHANEEYDFIPPELARGEPASAETDVYSVALLVLALRLGRSVLLRKGSLETVRAAMSADIEPALFEQLTPELGGVLLRALDRDPQKRPFSPRQLAAQLRAAVPGAERADLAAALDGLAPERCGAHPSEI